MHQPGRRRHHVARFKISGRNVPEVNAVALGSADAAPSSNPRFKFDTEMPPPASDMTMTFDPRPHKQRVPRQTGTVRKSVPE